VRMRQQLVLPLLVIFLFVSVFGMYAMFAHTGHDVDCPFMPSAISCATSLVGHINHWQTAFASMLEILLLAIVVLVRPRVLFAFVPQTERYRLDFRSTQGERPTLYQELYSRGIHNRKEP
jgi:choline-glycine betaine transporter